MLFQVLEEAFHDEAHIFQDTYFESSQIHLLTIMYHVEQSSHNIILFFYFKIFTNCFCVHLIFIGNIFYI